jgi:hypothetical protein
MYDDFAYLGFVRLDKGLKWRIIEMNGWAGTTGAVKTNIRILPN